VFLSGILNEDINRNVISEISRELYNQKEDVFLQPKIKIQMGSIRLKRSYHAQQFSKTDYSLLSVPRSLAIY